jgi:hypothetical protein
MNQPTLFDGITYNATQDETRLSGQLQRVKTLMLDGQWRTLAQIATAVCGSEAGVSARLRDCRKVRFGAHTVERRRVDGGLWQYRVISK